MGVERLVSTINWSVSGSMLIYRRVMYVGYCHPIVWKNMGLSLLDWWVPTGKKNNWPRPGHIFWLVVSTYPKLKNDGVKVSWDDFIPKWMESHKIPWFQTTNHWSLWSTPVWSYHIGSHSPKKSSIFVHLFKMVMFYSSLCEITRG